MGLSKNKSNEDSDLEFTHISGGIYAITVPEPIQFPVQDIKEIALEYLLESDPNASIVSEDIRNINGKNILCARMNVRLNSMPMNFISCYYSDDRGTIQFQTITAYNLYNRYKKDID